MLDPFAVSFNPSRPSGSINWIIVVIFNNYVHPLVARQLHIEQRAIRNSDYERMRSAPQCSDRRRVCPLPGWNRDNSLLTFISSSEDYREVQRSSNARIADDLTYLCHP